MENRTKHHISSSIGGLLKLSNLDLRQLFGFDGGKVREELLQRKANGELLIPSEGCEGFDPIKGCPGHPAFNSLTPSGE